MYYREIHCMQNILYPGWWVRRVDAPSGKHPIGHIWSIFSVADIRLVTIGVCSQWRTPDWSPLEDNSSKGHTIGHIWIIFSVADTLLVTGGGGVAEGDRARGAGREGAGGGVAAEVDLSV
jgi:lipoprotein signal peptidase